MARRIKDLTQGDIVSTLVKLALPIMGTGLLNMLYSLTDIMWLGRLNREALAGAGTAGYFVWFAAGIIMISQTGVGVGVAQSIGKEDSEGLREYISNALRLNLTLAILYCATIFIFRHQLISFFKIDDIDVVNQATWYLEIVSFGLLFQFFNPVISSIFNATGNSLAPFVINAMGLLTNMILDPVLIFGLGPFPALGIRGAAIATSIAQITVLTLFVTLILRSPELFSGVRIFARPNFDYIKRIAKLGIPGFLQNSMHSGISMIIIKFLANWGSAAIAVQTAGAQIESISWMTAEGFSAALTAFVGQNYGARNNDRVREGYKKGVQIVGSIGALAMVLFIFFGEPIFSLFIPNDPEAINLGGHYLKILGFSQIFLCLEIAAMGGFNGIGRPIVPAVIGTIFNVLRIPGALLLSSTSLGVYGIWWAVSGSSIIKGALGAPLCSYALKNLKE